VYWFAGQKVKRGDFVVLYSKSGTKSEKKRRWDYLLFLLLGRITTVVDSRPNTGVGLYLLLAGWEDNKVGLLAIVSARHLGARGKANPRRGKLIVRGLHKDMLVVACKNSWLSGISTSGFGGGVHFHQSTALHAIYAMRKHWWSAQ
jgi:hypothetical protein